MRHVIRNAPFCHPNLQYYLPTRVDVPITATLFILCNKNVTYKKNVQKMLLLNGDSDLHKNKTNLCTHMYLVLKSNIEQ